MKVYHRYRESTGGVQSEHEQSAGSGHVMRRERKRKEARRPEDRDQKAKKKKVGVAKMAGLYST